MKSYTKIIIALTLLFGIFSVFKAPGDPDFGWHFKYGEYFVNHGQILRENTFSYTFSDYKWANSYWVSQALLYLSHYYLGHAAAGLIFSFILSFTTILYIKSVSKRSGAQLSLQAFVCILLFVEFSGSGVTNRPMFFSSLFLMLIMTLLLNDEFTGSKRVLAMPLIFLVWANTHADFVLGLFILGLYVADKIIVGQDSSKMRQKILLAIIGLASAAITVVNPYGLELWKTLAKESHPYQFNHISEWVPVGTDNPFNFVIYCATLGILVSALIGVRRKLPLWYLLSLGAFCILAVRSQYFFRIAVILGAYAVLVFWSPYLCDLSKLISSDLLSRFRLGFFAFLAISTLAITSVFLDNIKESTNEDYWVEKQGYPRDALNYALANNVSGNVFNYYGWGGYMIWQYPQIRTFVDGRMPSWRKGNLSVFEDYIKTVDSPKKNIKLMDNYNVNWILYPTDSNLVKFLKTPDSGWKELYADSVASVFVIIKP